MKKDNFSPIDEAIAAGKKKKERDYWIKQLSGDWSKTCFPIESPAKNHQENNDFTTNSSPTPTGHYLKGITFQFPAELFALLMKISGGADTKIYMLLLAGLVILLERYTGSRDIIVASPVLQQEREVIFINTILTLRNRFEKKTTFKKLLFLVRQTVIQATEHQNYPLKSLVNQLNISSSTDDFPLFDIGVLLENIHNKKYLQAVPLNMIFSFKKSGDHIRGKVEYNPLRYSRKGVEQITSHFCNLLQEALTHNDKQVIHLEMLSKEEKRRLLVDLNDTARKSDWSGKPLARIFEEQATKFPDAIAVVTLEERIPRKTYRGPYLMSASFNELNKRASQLAGKLQEKDIKPGSIVGLMVERSLHVAVGIIAVLKAGGAYLPMDSQYPGSRNLFLLRDSQAHILLAQSHLINEKVELFDWLPSDRVISIDDPKLYETGFPQLNNFVNPQNPGYIIYTSGTTGLPKGVIIEQHSIANLVKGLNETVYKNYPAPLHLHVCLVSPYVFDASVKQVFGALLLGHCLHVVSADTRVDGMRLLEYFNRHQIDISDGTPIHIRLLSESMETANPAWQAPPSCPCCVKRFLIGGEALPGETTAQFLKKWRENPPVITNVYGPTECCVDTSFYHIFVDNINNYDFIPIGQPMPNYRVYTLDREYRLLPIGLSGELCIGGEGVARGYLNRPELTFVKFCLQRPGGAFEKLPPGPAIFRKSFLLPLYLSGDLGRWLSDGFIEYVGRIDQQVKIRGFRVELGEIENELLKCETVSAAAVTARDDLDGDKYLCAYIVPVVPANSDNGGRDNSDTLQLKEYLSQELPPYLVPLYIISLEEIPLTHNGKVDKNRLPEPDTLGAGEKYEAPRDEMEKKLAEIWAEVLKVNQDTIGIDSNFFQLGGHSLKATVQVTKIHKEFDVKVPLSKIFNSPTIREISAFIKGSGKEHFASIEPVEKKEYYPASSAQKRLYVLQQMDLQSTGYNMPRLVVLDGELDIDRFQESFKKLTKRHEILRTAFATAGEVIQKIHPTVNFEIEYTDPENNQKLLPKMAGPGGETPRFLEKSPPGNSSSFIINHFIRPFDLTRAPLMRVGLIKTGDHEYILAIDMHHIISDAISQVIFIQDLMEFYGGNDLPQLKLRYRDFSAWQNHLVTTGQMKKQEEFWLKSFAGKIPLLNMPLDYSRPSEAKFKGSSFRFDLESSLIEKIHDTVTRTDTTLNIFLLAVYNVLLSKYTGQTDIIVGIVTAGRRHADLQDIIGFFVNMLAMRNQPGEGKTFREFLTEVKENSIKCYENQDYQFEELVAQLDIPREPGRHPLVDTVFTLRNIGVQVEDIPDIKSGKLRLRPYQYSTRVAHFDLLLSATDIDDFLSLTFEYSDSLFKESTIEEMCKCYVEILEQVAEELDMLLKDIAITHEFISVKSNVLENQNVDFEF